MWRCRKINTPALLGGSTQTRSGEFLANSNRSGEQYQVSIFLCRCESLTRDCLYVQEKRLEIHKRMIADV